MKFRRSMLVSSGVLSSLFSSAVLMCFLVLAQPAAADQPSAENAPSDSAAQKSEGDKDGAEVVVVASRGQPQDTLDIPQAISDITRERLDKEEYRDLDDLVRLEPNIIGAPAEGNPNYWQEGFSIRGLGAQRVLVLTDGVRQAGQGVGYGGGNLSLYDPYAIERIEILRGPASVLYGTDAFGGVINIISRSPRERSEFGVNGGMRYVYDGSQNMNRYGGYFDVGDKNYGIVGGGSYLNAGEPNLPEGYDPHSGSFRNSSGWGKAVYNITDDMTFRLMGDLNRTKDIKITDSAFPLPIATFPPPGSMELVNSPLRFEIPTYQRSMLGGEVEIENLDFFEDVKTGVYWQRLKRNFERQTPFLSNGSPGFAGPPLFVDPTSTVTSSSVETDDRVDILEWQSLGRIKSGDHLVTVGFDLGYDSAFLPETETQTVLAVAGSGVAGGGAVSSVDRVRANASQYRFGLFSQDNWRVGKYIDMIPGVRVDYYTVNDDQSNLDDDQFGVSGSLGTVGHITENDSLYLTLATGYRAPDLGERFQNGVVNIGVPSRLIGKSDLDPERAYTAEFGSKGTHDRLHYEGATFYTHISDYIGTQALGVVDGFDTEQYNNVGDVNLYGVEGTLSYKILDEVELFGNAGKTYTLESEKIDVAGFIYNYGVQYTQDLCECTGFKQFRAALVARSAADSVDNTQTGGRNPFPSNAGFTILNLETNLVLAKTSWGQTSLLGGVRNIFDKTYREPFFDQPQPGINGYVGIQIEF